MATVGASGSFRRRQPSRTFDATDVKLFASVDVSELTTFFERSLYTASNDVMYEDRGMGEQKSFQNIRLSRERFVFIYRSLCSFDHSAYKDLVSAFDYIVSNRERKDDISFEEYFLLATERNHAKLIPREVVQYLDTQFQTLAKGEAVLTRTQYETILKEDSKELPDLMSRDLFQKYGARRYVLTELDAIKRGTKPHSMGFRTLILTHSHECVKVQRMYARRNQSGSLSVVVSKLVNKQEQKKSVSSPWQHRNLSSKVKHHQRERVFVMPLIQPIMCMLPSDEKSSNVEAILHRIFARALSVAAGVVSTHLHGLEQLVTISGEQEGKLFDSLGVLLTVLDTIFSMTREEAKVELMHHQKHENVTPSVQRYIVDHLERPHLSTTTTRKLSWRILDNSSFCGDKPSSCGTRPSTHAIAERLLLQTASLMMSSTTTPTKMKPRMSRSMSGSDAFSMFAKEQDEDLLLELLATSSYRLVYAKLQHALEHMAGIKFASIGELETVLDILTFDDQHQYDNIISNSGDEDVEDDSNVKLTQSSTEFLKVNYPLTSSACTHALQLRTCDVGKCYAQLYETLHAALPSAETLQAIQEVWLTAMDQHVAGTSTVLAQHLQRMKEHHLEFSTYEQLTVVLDLLLEDTCKERRLKTLEKQSTEASRISFYVRDFFASQEEFSSASQAVLGIHDHRTTRGDVTSMRAAVSLLIAVMQQSGLVSSGAFAAIVGDENTVLSLLLKTFTVKFDEMVIHLKSIQELGDYVEDQHLSCVMKILLQKGTHTERGILRQQLPSTVSTYLIDHLVFFAANQLVPLSVGVYSFASELGGAKQLFLSADEKAGLSVSAEAQRHRRRHKLSKASQSRITNAMTQLESLLLSDCLKFVQTFKDKKVSFASATELCTVLECLVLSDKPFEQHVMLQRLQESRVQSNRGLMEQLRECDLTCAGLDAKADVPTLDDVMNVVTADPKLCNTEDNLEFLITNLLKLGATYSAGRIQTQLSNVMSEEVLPEDHLHAFVGAMMDNELGLVEIHESSFIASNPEYLKHCLVKNQAEVKEAAVLLSTSVVSSLQEQYSVIYSEGSEQSAALASSLQKVFTEHQIGNMELVFMHISKISAAKLELQSPEDLVSFFTLLTQHVDVVRPQLVVMSKPPKLRFSKKLTVYLLRHCSGGPGYTTADQIPELRQAHYAPSMQELCFRLLQSIEWFHVLASEATAPTVDDAQALINLGLTVRASSMLKKVAKMEKVNLVNVAPVHVAYALQVLSQPTKVELPLPKANASSFGEEETGLYQFVVEHFVDDSDSDSDDDYTVLTVQNDNVSQTIVQQQIKRAVTWIDLDEDSDSDDDEWVATTLCNDLVAIPAKVQSVQNGLAQLGDAKQVSVALEQLTEHNVPAAQLVSAVELMVGKTEVESLHVSTVSPPLQIEGLRKDACAYILENCQPVMLRATAGLARDMERDETVNDTNMKRRLMLALRNSPKTLLPGNVDDDEMKCAIDEFLHDAVVRIFAYIVTHLHKMEKHGLHFVNAELLIDTLDVLCYDVRLSTPELPNHRKQSFEHRLPVDMQRYVMTQSSISIKEVTQQWTKSKSLLQHTVQQGDEGKQSTEEVSTFRLAAILQRELEGSPVLKSSTADVVQIVDVIELLQRARRKYTYVALCQLKLMSTVPTVTFVSAKQLFNALSVLVLCSVTPPLNQVNVAINEIDFSIDAARAIFRSINTIPDSKVKESADADDDLVDDMTVDARTFVQHIVFPRPPHARPLFSQDMDENLTAFQVDELVDILQTFPSRESFAGCVEQMRQGKGFDGIDNLCVALQTVSMLTSTAEELDVFDYTSFLSQYFDQEDTKEQQERAALRDQLKSAIESRDELRIREACACVVLSRFVEIMSSSLYRDALQIIECLTYARHILSTAFALTDEHALHCALQFSACVGLTSADSKEVKRCETMYNDVHELNEEARSALNDLDADKMRFVFHEARAMGLRSEYIDVIRELLYDLPEEKFVQLQLKRAIRNKDEARISAMMIRTKDLFFLKQGSLFTLRNFNGLHKDTKKWPRAKGCTGMLEHQSKPLKKSLTVLNSALEKDAIKMFTDLLIFAGEIRDKAPKYKIATILNRIEKSSSPEMLVTELYCQLMKQLTEPSIAPTVSIPVEAKRDSLFVPPMNMGGPGSRRGSTAGSSRRASLAEIMDGDYAERYCDMLRIALHVFPPAIDLENFLEYYLRCAKLGLNSNSQDGDVDDDSVDFFVDLLHRKLAEGKTTYLTEIEISTLLTAGETFDFWDEKHPYVPTERKSVPPSPISRRASTGDGGLLAIPAQSTALRIAQFGIAPTVPACFVQGPVPLELYDEEQRPAVARASNHSRSHRPSLIDIVNPIAAMTPIQSPHNNRQASTPLNFPSPNSNSVTPVPLDNITEAAETPRTAERRSSMLQNIKRRVSSVFTRPPGPNP